jgi:hypothetical protein
MRGRDSAHTRRYQPLSVFKSDASAAITLAVDGYSPSEAVITPGRDPTYV